MSCIHIGVFCTCIKHTLSKNKLYLSLDIYHPMRFSLGRLKQLHRSSPRQQLHGSLLLLQQLFRRVLQDEPRALLVRLEPQFFGDEPDLHIGFVPITVNLDSKIAEREGTHALQIAVKADKRSRSTNMSIR